MTNEHRLLIELIDIAGIEFECQSCAAKILYPLARQDRLAAKCPNCYESWFIEEPGPRNPNVPTTVENVNKAINHLRELIKTPLVRARVRLLIENKETPAF